MLGALLIVSLGTAQAAFDDRLEFGLGLRGMGGPFDSGSQLHAIGRYGLLSTLSVELDLGTRLGQPKPSQIHDFGQNMANIIEQGSGESSFGYPITQETWALEALIDWSIVPRDYSDPWVGGARILTGPAFRGVQDAFLVFDEESADQSDENTTFEDAQTGAQVGISIGFGLDLWYTGKYGARLSILDRMFAQERRRFDIENPSSDGKELIHHVTVSFDLLYGVN